MSNLLLLLSGNDIPFQQAQLSIHQPTMKEIAYIGQENFFIGCQYLNFSKKNLNEQGKNHLKNSNDFDILMTMIRENANNSMIQKSKTCMQLVLLLMFPQYKINFLPMSILLTKQNDKSKQSHLIDRDNFEAFKTILQEMFCLKEVHGSNSSYNPGGPQANALVQKFKQRQQKLAKIKNKGKKTSISIFSRYISILAVGEKKDMNELLQYTVYQLLDQFNRFKKRETYQIYIRFKAAGATNLDEDNIDWMSDIHSEK